MRLLDRIRSIEPTRLALVCGDVRMSFGALADQAEALAALPALSGLRLLLNMSNPVQAAIAFVALDTTAEAIILTSPEQDDETLADLARASGATFILSDVVRGLPVPVITSLEGLPVALDRDVGLAMAQPTSWIMTTSGTTGKPKLVSHTLDSLTRTARTDQARGAGQVWGLLYDFTRFAGLQVMLQSLLSGAVLLVPSVDQPLSARLRWLAEKGCTHLSATPTYWRKILMSDGHDALNLKQVTLGGEIADTAILKALARRYPLARLSHIFASTEAGVGFSVTDGQAGFPLSYLESPPTGIGLKMEEGRLLVRNDLVGSHYLGSHDRVAEKGWVDTGDLLDVVGDRVHFKGRASGVINVGGNKVHPEEIEHILLTHPEVQFAHVYSKANPITGALVAADIVPMAGAREPAVLRAEIATFLKGKLDRHKVPAFIRFVEDFDMNSAGKLKRS
jgi:acyl-CoA synthetase (AMP-forming)/AMP-acid ligase II